MPDKNMLIVPGLITAMFAIVFAASGYMSAMAIFWFGLLYLAVKSLEWDSK